MTATVVAVGVATAVVVAAAAVAAVPAVVVVARALVSDTRHESDSNQTGSTHTNNPKANVGENSS